MPLAATSPHSSEAIDFVRNINMLSFNEVVSALLNTYFSEFETLLVTMERLKQEQSL